MPASLLSLLHAEEEKDRVKAVVTRALLGIIVVVASSSCEKLKSKPPRRPVATIVSSDLLVS